MEVRLVDYIKELVLRLKSTGEELPTMREDIAHLLVYEGYPPGKKF